MNICPTPGKWDRLIWLVVDVQSQRLWKLSTCSKAFDGLFQCSGPSQNCCAKVFLLHSAITKAVSFLSFSGTGASSHVPASKWPKLLASCFSTQALDPSLWIESSFHDWKTKHPNCSRSIWLLVGETWWNDVNAITKVRFKHDQLLLHEQCWLGCIVMLCNTFSTNLSSHQENKRTAVFNLIQLQSTFRRF